MTTFQKVIAELSKAFTTDKRDDGKRFYKLRDDAPAWLSGTAGSDFMHAIHVAVDGPSPRLPDDWIYEQTAAIARDLKDREIESYDDAREATHEIADGMVDIYNGERYAWLAQNNRNAELCDEATSEYGSKDDATMTDRIGLGQFLALERIAGSIIEQCEARAEEIDAEEDEQADGATP